MSIFVSSSTTAQMDNIDSRFNEAKSDIVGMRTMCEKWCERMTYL